MINIINTARENALKKVNEELISMYWQVGEYLHEESQRSSFGESYIDSIAKEQCKEVHISAPGLFNNSTLDFGEGMEPEITRTFYDSFSKQYLLYYKNIFNKTM